MQNNQFCQRSQLQILWHSNYFLLKYLSCHHCYCFCLLWLPIILKLSDRHMVPVWFKLLSIITWSGRARKDIWVGNYLLIFQWIFSCYDAFYFTTQSCYCRNKNTHMQVINREFPPVLDIKHHLILFNGLHKCPTFIYLIHASLMDRKDVYGSLKVQTTLTMNIHIHRFCIQGKKNRSLEAELPSYRVMVCFTFW